MLGSFIIEKAELSPIGVLSMNHENGPLVTAVIPVYNHEKYVAESIRSIIQQTYRNIELIVINDGSKDRSHEVVLGLTEECKRRFVRFEYINRENRGLSATLDQALGMAKGNTFPGLPRMMSLSQKKSGFWSRRWNRKTIATPPPLATLSL